MLNGTMSCSIGTSTLTKSSQDTMHSNPITEIHKLSGTSTSVLTQEGVAQNRKRRSDTTENGPSHLQDTCKWSCSYTPTDCKSSKTTKNTWLVNSEPTQISQTNTRSLTSIKLCNSALVNQMTCSSLTTTGSKISSLITSSTREQPDLMMPSIKSCPQMMKHQFVIDGTMDDASRWPAAIIVSVIGVTDNTKWRIALLDAKNQRKNNEEWWKWPCWMRGFLWSYSAPSRTPSATSTETAIPWLSIPALELSNVTTKSTINNRLDLFSIVTLINVNKFDSLLLQHLNWPLVESVCRSLREGAWLYATINPNDPLTFNSSSHSLDNAASSFVQEQWDLKIVAGRYSASFGTELLPGMFSPLISAVPKLHSMNLRLINDHSAGPHSLNSWIDRSDTHIRLDNLHDLGVILCSVMMSLGHAPHWLFNSDILLQVNAVHYSARDWVMEGFQTVASARVLHQPTIAGLSISRIVIHKFGT